MKIFAEEELLEPIARYFRFRQGTKFISKRQPISLADLGCGPKIRFYDFARKKGIKFKKYLGIDPLLNNLAIKQYGNLFNLRAIKAPLQTRIPLKSESVDYVVGFAFLEHISNPGAIINDAIRVLKPGGRAIFTTPAITAKPILEFLSFKLGLISPREIAEHKNYFTKERLSKLIRKKYLKRVKIFHRYFLILKSNNLFIIDKLKTQ